MAMVATLAVTVDGSAVASRTAAREAAPAAAATATTASDDTLSLGSDTVRPHPGDVQRR